MSRENVGIFVGILTLLALILPVEVFVFVIAVLSFLIAKEVSTALQVKEVSYFAFLIPLIYVSLKPLTLPVVGILSLAYGYKSWSLQGFSFSFLTLVYAGLFPAFLIDIKAYGFKYILLLVLTVWAIDVSAYYIGRRFGRTSVFPKISPKKTLEGYLGAFVVSFLIFWMLSGWGFLLSLFTVFNILLFGAIGDYFKSFVKRQVGIKDFADTLGEHGGFTDRFDSLIFSAPVYLLILERAVR